MRTFNNSDLFTGYLKQLLHSFNLPKVKVYTQRHAQYYKKYKKESPEILETLEATPRIELDATARKLATPNQNVRYFPYIKDGELQEYVNGKWQNISFRLDSTTNKTIRDGQRYKYTYGEKLLNHTKTLRLNTNTYDSYTHEYLGDYLRFHRDFLNFDLMPLYNCFSNRPCDKLKLQWQTSTGSIVSFDSSDTNFKIYMIPVKLFQKYTIAIDSTYPVEMCCGIYGDYQDKRKKFATLPHVTYQRVTHSTFSQPFLYTALASDDGTSKTTFIEQLLTSTGIDSNTLIELAQNETDLKLFLKVPVTNNSTIVILEGDYLGWNDSIWNMSAKQEKCVNKSVINIDINAKLYDLNTLKLRTPLQLLQLNTKEQHPFADRLIEYLIGNAIAKSETEIYDNIRRAQKALASNYSANNYMLGIPGVWSSEMTILFYEYMTSGKLANKFNINHDLLGYVDKDTEKYYQATTKSPTSTSTAKISLANIELKEGDK